jgi:N-acetylmuramate 1-kinase
MDNRKSQSDAFLLAHGWGQATRSFLAGDASDRTYDRITKGHDTAVLMDAPPGRGDDPALFVATAEHLRRAGLSVPKVLAQDLLHGFLLLEDFGDNLFARMVNDHAAGEADLYTAAVDALLCLQAAPAMPTIPDLTADDWATAALFAVEWYAFGVTGQRNDSRSLHDILATALSRAADGPRVLIHRDFHAENLIWLPKRTGIRRVGILDFQLLQMGQPVYDLVSLLQDARRDGSAPTFLTAKRHYLERTGQNAVAFEHAFAVIGAQRALRILGIFARLCLTDGKGHYVSLIPRVWLQLQTNLAHPALHQLRDVCMTLLPVPTPENLALLREKCGKAAGP